MWYFKVGYSMKRFMKRVHVSNSIKWYMQRFQVGYSIKWYIQRFQIVVFVLYGVFSNSL